MTQSFTVLRRKVPVVEMTNAELASELAFCQRSPIRNDRYLASVEQVWRSRNQVLVLPVVHVGGSEDTAFANSKLAFDEGADGVFIIGHGYPGDLLDLACRIKAANDNRWVGINWLGKDPHTMMKMLAERPLDGLWTDNADVEENNENQYPEYVRLLQLHNPNTHDLLYFGGTAFKYQRQPADLNRAAHLASNFMDYICTSGPGTGKAADVRKIQEMARGVTKPLAIASGVTPENVLNYIGPARAFLVATGISHDFFNFDRERLAKLVHNVRGWNPPKETA